MSRPFGSDRTGRLILEPTPCTLEGWDGSQSLPRNTKTSIGDTLSTRCNLCRLKAPLVLFFRAWAVLRRDLSYSNLNLTTTHPVNHESHSIRPLTSYDDSSSETSISSPDTAMIRLDSIPAGLWSVFEKDNRSYPTSNIPGTTFVCSVLDLNLLESLGPRSTSAALQLVISHRTLLDLRTLLNVLL